MSTAGPNYAGTAANAGGGNAWTTVTNAQGAPDAAFATVTNPGDINLTNFGFAIPGNAIVNGVTVESDDKASSGTNPITGKLIVAGVRQASSRSGSPVPTTVLAFETLGGSADLWGVGSLTGADVNASNFGVYLVMNGSGTPTWSIDAVRITIDYTVPPGGAPPMVQSAIVRPRSAPGLISNDASRLIGFDTVTGAPGQSPDIEIPPARPRARSSQDFRLIANNAQRLMGLDTMTGAPGQVPDIDIPPARPRSRPSADTQLILNLGARPGEIVTNVSVQPYEIPPARGRPRFPTDATFLIDNALRLVGQESGFVLPIEIAPGRPRHAGTLDRLLWNNALRLLGADTLLDVGESRPYEIAPGRPRPRFPVASELFFNNDTQRMLEILRQPPGYEIAPARPRPEPSLDSSWMLNRAHRLQGLDYRPPEYLIEPGRPRPRVAGWVIVFQNALPALTYVYIPNTTGRRPPAGSARMWVAGAAGSGRLNSTKSGTSRFGRRQPGAGR